MPSKLLRRFATFFRQNFLGGLIPEGERGLKLIGHRNYVGGMWDKIGTLQFEFLKSQGLRPADVLLDIGCGALRGGVHYIHYLDSGNYIGFDKERAVVSLGLLHEVSEGLIETKHPSFVISESFDFSELPQVPTYSIAVSLFTHLTLEDISKCLNNLRQAVHPGHCCFATFFEGSSFSNPSTSHSLDHFQYSKKQINDAVDQAQWRTTYIGDWGHPRAQVMYRFDAISPHEHSRNA